MGEQCPFIHDAQRLAQKQQQARGSKGKDRPRQASSTGDAALDSGVNEAHDVDATSSAITVGRQYLASPVDQSRVVQRPVPAAQVSNPRDFQLQQLRRRFSPRESDSLNGTDLVLRLVPSDPDFPFELGALECVLFVPLSYPQSRSCRLRVTNKDIPRGYQINVEQGFDKLLETMPQATLLSLMNALDRSLEGFLAEQKRDTVKLLRPATVGGREPSAASQQTTALSNAPVPKDQHSAELIERTKSKRSVEVRQLEARLGRDPTFSKSMDGLTYTLPLEPRRRTDLPVPLRTVDSLRLHVPPIYNLEPCAIELLGVSRAAASTTENAFLQRARKHPETSLLGHINYLTQNMYVMATTEVLGTPSDLAPEVQRLRISDGQSPSSSILDSSKSVKDERFHIKVIPRPPEWDVGACAAEDEESDASSSDAGTGSDEEVRHEADTGGTDIPPPRAERGTSLSFPTIELYGIELLEIVILDLTIKCERCKQVVDVHKIEHEVKRESCGKCANVFTIGTLPYQAGLIFSS